MKPTDGELEIAVIAAEELWQSGRDEHHLGKTLLYLYQRLDAVDRVRVAAENYLHSGQEASLEAELRQAIDAADRMERRETAADVADPPAG